MCVSSHVPLCPCASAWLLSQEPWGCLINTDSSLRPSSTSGASSERRDIQMEFLVWARSGGGEGATVGRGGLAEEGRYVH